ncbi:periplasmic heavy metal sensor [Salidesulfovibrio brasiliensis]|uniref:periplasmic heavy metal sensor n=1 Tax=Salidesulfovibrio brasiliensis TaxID=221711 RepID=UPI0006CF83F1|nr:periplasmic heavy metal sensor [Salidesulfovibrio brasiliensis]
MTRKTLIVTIALAAMLSMAAMAYAGPGYGRGGGCGGYGDGMYSQLTPEKQEAANQIFEKFRAKQTALHDKAVAARIKLDAIANSGNPDEKRIDELVAEMSKLRNQMWENRTAMAKEFEAETGLKFSGRGGRGSGNGYCEGYGQGRGYHGGGHGYGHGRGMDRW